MKESSPLMHGRARLEANTNRRPGAIDFALFVLLLVTLLMGSAFAANPFDEDTCVLVRNPAMGAAEWAAKVREFEEGKKRGLKCPTPVPPKVQAPPPFEIPPCGANYSGPVDENGIGHLAFVENRSEPGTGVLPLPCKAGAPTQPAAKAKNCEDLGHAVTVNGVELGGKYNCDLPECLAHIAVPGSIKPGDLLSPAATITRADGKPVQGTPGLTWFINGAPKSSVTWDGRETRIELQLSCQGHAQRFQTVLPAFAGSAAAAAASLPSSTLAPSSDWMQRPVPGLSGIGIVPGPKSALEGVVGVLAPGLMAILGGLLSGVFGSSPPSVTPDEPLASKRADEDAPVTESTSAPMQGASPPPEIEYTYPDGRQTALVYSPQFGGYINQLTGGLVAAQDIEDWKRQEESTQKNNAAWRASNAQQIEAERDAGRKSLAEAATRRADDNAAEQLRQRMIARLQQDKALSGVADVCIATKDTEGLKRVYRARLQDQIDAGLRDEAHFSRVATAFGVAETAARLSLSASKAALMTIGGPAGMSVSATALGAVAAAQEGAESYVCGDALREVVARTAGGFLSGAKDRAIGAYTNLPGTGRALKYLVPAAAETVETYIKASVDNPDHLGRSERLKRALATGGVSIFSDFLGGKVDVIKFTAGREMAKAGLAGLSAGTSSLIQGGSLGEGIQQGLEGAIGGRIGGRMGGKAADFARTKTERTVQKAINEIRKNKESVIGLEKQSEIIRDFDQQIKQIQQERVASGEKIGKIYVDEKNTLAQLRDTQSSRSAKQAPKYIQDAIIATRQDRIYGPADAATIAKAHTRLAGAGLLQAGDKLKMDTFSTPGKAVSLGADRDARLIIERDVPVTVNGLSSMKKMYIEVPRQHWEEDAYKDFFDHTTRINGGVDSITAQTHPDYFKRLEEMQASRKLEQVSFEQRTQEWERARASNPDFSQPAPRPPLTEEQLTHRAWAEVHNQLFTDKFHVEASADNADQLTRFVGGKVVDEQGISSVVSAQNGNQRLLDPAGYAKMWEEKSQVYARMDNPSEAIAQSQKGVESYMKLREGYHAQGYEVPPLDAGTARAMEVISRAPVGVDATPQAMAAVDAELKGLGYHSTNDALGKIAAQNEVLKFSRPRPEPSAGALAALGRGAPKSGA